MIRYHPPGWQPYGFGQRMAAEWQKQLAEAVRDPAELLRMLDLDPSLTEPAAAGRQFPLRVPRAFIARMRKGDPGDPLLRQVLPLAAEMQAHAGYSSDPVGDLASRAAPGVLHKYQGRVLLITTGVCGIHCRYCFRRHFPYAQEHARQQGWAEALTYIRADNSIQEVILSGGDPLSLNDEALAGLVAELERIPHLLRLRLHTRQPVVLPSRVDDRLLAWLAACKLQKIMVLHVNHARELDSDVATALARLHSTGALLLNQSVLLRDVNDSVAALAELSQALFARGVLPYYLNLLDPVQGAAHFEVPEPQALALMQGLRARLPGYLVPRLVREVPGAPSKIPVSESAFATPAGG
ncbi:MAG: EF-P beta-lysylation protein EpmB [Gammaproteobacteria bacterium]|nr:EF-P beta-lysylation protein EpmB [Gammaproteobacteria bacterium]